MDDKSDSHEFIFDLCDHQSAIHAVRFSPCGLMLAAASDRMITVYKGTLTWIFYSTISYFETIYVIVLIYSDLFGCVEDTVRYEICGSNMDSYQYWRDL